MAGLTVVGVACVGVYVGLRAIGLRPRWEVEPPPEPRPRIESPWEYRPELWEPASGDAEEEWRAEPQPPDVAASPRELGGFMPDAPRGGEPGAGAGRDDWPRAEIGFATYPNGRPVQSEAPAGEEWASLGLLLRFQSYTANSVFPSVLQAKYDVPPGAPEYVLGPAFASEELGLEAGVIHMDFPGRPRRVEFTIYGPDMIERFDVIPWHERDRLPPSTVAFAPDERYFDPSEPVPAPGTRRRKATWRPGGRTLFRAERVVVTHEAGIDRISLDPWGPPTHLLMVDDLVIDP